MRAFNRNKVAIVTFIPFLLSSTCIQAADNDEKKTAADDDKTETISIIGSRRPGRTVVDSNVPIDLIDASTLQAGGYTDINRQMQNVVPSFNYYQPSLVDGTEAIKPASLRGLAPDQTLVLVNGRRFHSSALLNINGSAGRGSVSVDMNTIPSAAIKRIEILRDGASAQYGSDAIAGVINIVTKDASEGGSIAVSGGYYDTTLDGVPEMTGVQTDASGNVVANGSGRVAGIYGDDISRTDGATYDVSTNFGVALGSDGFLNITGEYTHANRTNRGGEDDGDTYPLLDDGNFDPREITTNRDRFLYGSPKTESKTVLANAGYTLDSGVELYSTATFQDRDVVSGAFYREASDEGYLIQDIYPNGFTPQIHSAITDWSLLGGAKGALGKWDYDVSANYGENAVKYYDNNTANVTYLSDTPTSFYGGELIYNQAVINLDFSRLFDVSMLSTPLSFAWGLEYRREGYQIKAGDEKAYTNQQSTDADGNLLYDEDGNPVYPTTALFAQGSIYFSKDGEVDVSRHSYAIYAELDADLTDSLNATLAGRYEDYSDAGDTANAKLAARYKLFDSFAVRGSVSTGFRAPSLQQQYYTSVSTNFIDGVAYDVGTIPATSAAAEALGGSQLKPEKSTNYSVGFSWTPLQDLAVTVDAYRIDIDDRIVLSETLGDDDDEEAIVSQVFAENNIEGVAAARFFINGVDSTTKGVDITASYNVDALTGHLRLNAGMNFNDTSVSDVKASVGPASLFGASSLFARRERMRLENAAPSKKGNLSATWSKAAFDVTLRANYYGKVTQPGTTSSGDVTVDAATIFDAEFGYAFSDSLKFSVGVNNAFDKYPESSVDRDGGVATASQFDFITPYPGFSPYGFQGRYLFAKAVYTF